MEAVEDVGGRLYCLKKSFEFKRWAQRTQSHFFMLLADWREVKPIAEFLAHTGFEKPHALVVYTEHEKQYQQALRWASANSYGRPVHVLEPSYTGNDLALRAAKLLQESVAAEKEAPQRGVHVKTSTAQATAFVPAPSALFQVDLHKLLQESVAAEKEAPQRGVHVTTSTPQAAAFVPAPSALFQVVVNCCADLTPAMPLDQQRIPRRIARREEPGFIAMEGHNWVRPVMHMLASVFPFATREEINIALKMVEPVHYED